MERNKEFDSLIKEYFNGNSYTTIMNRFKVFKKIYPEVIDYLNEILKEIPEYEKPLSVLKAIIFDIEIKHCKECGKAISFSKRFHDFCSKRCSVKNEDTQNKIKSTYLKKFGVEYAINLNTDTEKAKQKYRETCLKKYGTDSYMKSADFLEKKKKRMIEKFGVDHPSKSKEIQENKKKTYIERFGADNPMKNLEIQTKQKESMLKKFGVENPMQLEENKIKNKESKLDKGYETIINEWKEYVIPLFTREEYEGFNSNKEYEWKCVKCGHIFKSKIYTTNYLKNKVSKYVARCPKCFPKIDTSHNIDLLNKKKQDAAYELILSYKDYVIPLFSREDYDGYFKVYKWKCVKCGREFESHIHRTDHTKFSNCPRCWVCYPRFIWCRFLKAGERSF